MKYIPSFILIALMLVATTLSAQELPEKLPAAMKGYELYSWQENDDWHFTLIPGTNRLKSYEEIISDENTIEENWVKITLVGEDALKDVLSRLPKKTEIYWGEGEQNLRMPPKKMVRSLQKHAKKHQVKLSAYLGK